MQTYDDFTPEQHAARLAWWKEAYTLPRLPTGWQWLDHPCSKAFVIASNGTDRLPPTRRDDTKRLYDQRVTARQLVQAELARVGLEEVA